MSPECLRWPKNCETLIPFSVINQNAKKINNHKNKEIHNNDIDGYKER